MTGFPPGPWDIVVQPHTIFNNEIKKLEIPNTSQVEVKHF